MVLNHLENTHGFCFPEEDREFLLGCCVSKSALKNGASGWYWHPIKNHVEISHDETGDKVFRTFVRYQKYWLNGITGSYCK